MNDYGKSVTTFLKRTIFFYKLCECREIPHTACGNVLHRVQTTVGEFNSLYDEVIEGNYSTKYFISVFVGLLRIPLK